MPYIAITLRDPSIYDCELQIDDQVPLPLYDGQLILTSEGTHQLKFSAPDVHGTITESFNEETAMYLYVSANEYGSVSQMPLYDMRELNDDEMFALDELFCSRISKSKSDSHSTDGKSTIVELVLCMFLGVLGAHKFYRGKIGMGILYLFTLGLLGFGTFVDFISIIIRLLKSND